MASANSVCELGAYFARRVLAQTPPYTMEDTIVSVMPEGTTLKRAEIFDRFYNKVGVEYRCDSANAKLQAVLGKLVDQGVLKRVKPGFYQR